MMIRAMMFCAVIGAGAVGFYTGWQMGDFDCGMHAAKARAEFSQQKSEAWTDGFNNGVRCGLIAYTYAPDIDPAKNDVPILTLRARYWYTAIEATRAFLPQVKDQDRGK